MYIGLCAYVCVHACDLRLSLLSSPPLPPLPPHLQAIGFQCDFIKCYLTDAIKLWDTFEDVFKIAGLKSSTLSLMVPLEAKTICVNFGLIF